MSVVNPSLAGSPSRSQPLLALPEGHRGSLVAADVDRFSRMRLNPLRRLTSRARGEHLAGKGGTSIDFCDYRDYAPGDDLRFLDWNILARTTRAYIKQFHLEEETHVAVLIDASESMRSGGKLALAVELAAGFLLMGLGAGETCSAEVLTADDKPRSERFRMGRVSIPASLRFLETASYTGHVPVDFGVERFLRRHSGRGLAIVLSDFLTTGDAARMCNGLFAAGLEPWLIQILDPWELEPELAGDLRLTDSETGETLDVSASAVLLDAYRAQREALSTMLATLARERAGRFQLISTASRAGAELSSTFRRGGWIR